MTNDETLVAVAAWGSWHADCPAGMVIVAASPGGSFAEARRHFTVSATEYAARGESKFTIDPARHAEIFGFQGTGSARAAAASERPATGTRLGDLVKKYGSGRASAAKPANELGQAKPWSEILKSLGYAKKGQAASEPGVYGGKSVVQISTQAVSTEQTAPAGRALPWKEILAKIEAEERPAR